MINESLLLINNQYFASYGDLIKRSKNMDDIYKNIEYYNPNKKRKIFDCY